ncbi:MAG TPA: hypothetical protein VD788_10720, partial [Candidatus Polarisedimenticolaceae bacterium]|nr:hypothetical protein [Candidatus Polarisedimenticolaceae bacterium]
MKISRRSFLEQSARTWVALHAGAWAAAAGERPVEQPVEQPMKLRELRLAAARPAELVPFYRDALGFEMLEGRDDAVAFRAGHTRLRFRRTEVTPAPYYHVAFNIPENKIERAVEWAGRRFPLIHLAGVGEPIVYFDFIDAHSIYFWDPAGNLLEFIARHELANAADGPFDASDILASSEIGIVVDDVPATVER